MVDFPSDRTAAPLERDAWLHENDRGLTLAQDGDWAEAAEAFASAADSLARRLPDACDVMGESHHEPLALVLGNLAQACFRTGRLDDALRHAQRSCALRVAIAGEDGMPVARARMDLAVMLATGGRVEEATALVQRAVAGLEHRVGEDDERLIPVLENAARIALAAGRVANAEPLLLRLHALLDAHDRSTASADLLLARVAEVRAQQQQQQKQQHAAAVPAPSAAPVAIEATAPVAQEAPPAVVVVPSTSDTTTVAVATPAGFVDVFEEPSARVYAHASIADLTEWEDQPLRDAVAVTDLLLRTTPTGAPIIPAPPAIEPPSLVVDDVASDDADAMLDTMDLTDVLPVRYDVNAPFDRPASATPADAFDALDLLEPTPALESLDLEFTDTREAPAAIPAPAPMAMPMPTSESGLLLDFAVEHGMAGDEDTLVQRPPISLPVPDMHVPDVQAPDLPLAAGLLPDGHAAPAAVGTAHDAASASSRTAGEPAPRASGARARSATPPHATRPERRTPESRVVLPAPTESKGKGGLIALIAGAVAIGGAAAFFLLR